MAILNAEQEQAVLAAYAKTGDVNEVVRETMVPDVDIVRHRHASPEFDAKWKAARQPRSDRAGEDALAAVEANIRSYLAGDTITKTKQVVMKDGTIITLESTEPVQLSPAVVKMALQRYEPGKVADVVVHAEGSWDADFSA